MTQLTHTADMIVERRRLGVWIVAARSRFFTIHFGRNAITMDVQYRVTCGAQFEDFPDFESAVHYCRPMRPSRGRAR